MNLICALCTVYLVLPIPRVKSKYTRGKAAERINEECGWNRYNVRGFRRRFRLGVTLEALLAVGAVVLFLLTEDMRLPIALIDRWTPAMLLLLLASLLVDLTLTRLRERKPPEEDA